MKLTLKIATGIALILVIFNKIDFYMVVETIRNVDIWLLLLTNVIFIFANVILCPVKIKLLLKTDGYDIPLKEIISIYWIGMFFNRFLPGGIGGDIIKAYGLAQVTKDSEKAISSVLMERLSGIFAIVPIVLFSLALYYKKLPLSLTRDVLLFIFAVIAGMVVFFNKRMMEGLISILEGLRFKGLVSKIRGSYLSLYNYRNHGLVVFQVFILSVLFYMIAISAMWLLALSINFNAPITYFFIFLPIIFIVETLPVTISGIGVRESAYAYFFSMAGFDPSLAVSLSFLHFLLGIVNSSFGGIIFVLRR